MAKLYPFKAIRPRKGIEDRIAALPYDVYSRKEAEQEVQREPLSFLKIDRGETQFGPEVESDDVCAYERARDTLWEMVKTGDFIMEDKPCFYLYELKMKDRIQTGIVACSDIDEYLNGTIKKHENTRKDKEQDRICHVDYCDAQTGPIFLTYRKTESISKLQDKIKKTPCLYDFVTSDMISHRVWCISDEAEILTLEEEFGKIQSLYIADGHHRCASAVKVGLMRRKENKMHQGNEEYNRFLSVLFPDNELLIMDYNRVVKDLNGLTEIEFLERVGESFELKNIGDQAFIPKKKTEFGMFLGKKWYRISPKIKAESSDPVELLDVTVLQEKLLQPILGIIDPKTDKRIDFVGGIRGIQELERRVQNDCAVAFSLFPTSIEELFAVADEEKLMPPKSTWFEPKLRSGLFIHSIK